MTSTDDPNPPTTASDTETGPTIPAQRVPAEPSPPPAPDSLEQGAARSGAGRTFVVVTGVAAVVVGAGIAIGVAAALDQNNSSSTVATVSGGTTTAGAEGPVARAATVIGPSVVTIEVAGPGGAGGTGTGVILRADGYILTNDHVVTLDNAAPAAEERISVALSNGNSSEATVVGTDPPDDLAVIKVPAEKLAPATFANSSDLQVGQEVVAVGAPLGLSNTVTSGIVSALDRPVQAGPTGGAIFAAIQTDAAINPGNSGGPLVDLAGHVVGINAAIATAGSGSGESGSIGIGFAIPSDQATRIADDLIRTGKATHAVLGVAVQPATTSASGGPTSPAGARVVAVDPGGPAAAAGIRAGDVITEVAGQRIDDPVGLTAAVRSHAPGDTVSITLTRDGTTMTVKAKLAGVA
jgi:putative serine protease PepD